MEKMNTKQTIKKIQKQMDRHYKFMDRHYKFIDCFVNDCCKSVKEKGEFYKHFNEIIELNIEAEKLCNQ